MIRKILILITALLCVHFLFTSNLFISKVESICPSDDSERPRLLLVSSVISESTILSEAAKTGVIVIRYDAHNDTLESLMDRIDESLSGTLVSSVGIAAHDCGNAQFYLLRSAIISLNSSLVDSVQQKFWRRLGDHIVTGGHIDLFACNLASTIEGKLLVSSISETAGKNVAASTNATGNRTASGDWLLETKNIDVANAYFIPEKLALFRGLLATEIKKLLPVDYRKSDLHGYAIDVYKDFAIVGSPMDDDKGFNSGSAYIFSRNQGGTDNWGLTKKIVVPDGTGEELFGSSVTIDTEYAVVGSPYESVSNPYSGAAYIFYRYAGGTDNWGFVKKLTPATTHNDDHFGYSVDIFMYQIVVGAKDEDAGVSNGGAAYVFERGAGGHTDWSQTKRLEASTRASNDNYGHAVSISVTTIAVASIGAETVTIYDKDLGGTANWGERKIISVPTAPALFGQSISLRGNDLAVGAPLDSSAGSNAGIAYLYSRHYGGTNNFGLEKTITAFDAAEDNLFGVSVFTTNGNLIVGATSPASSGKAYIFSENTGGSGNWGLVKKVTPSDGQPSDFFGNAVAINTTGQAIVCARNKSDFGALSGAAYVYEKDLGGTNNWGQLKRLMAFDAHTGDLFGSAVKVKGEYAVVGAYTYDGAFTNSGAAFVYVRDQGGTNNWGQVTKLTQSDPNEGDYFGWAVGVAADGVVLVGAYGDDAAANDAGAAYIFKKDEGGADVWGQVKKIMASDPGEEDQFGRAVHLHGSEAIIGAPYNNDAGSDSGSAYLYYANTGGADNWGQIKKFTASDAQGGDLYGYSVSCFSEYIAISAPGDNDDGADSGSVYIYIDPIAAPGTWPLSKKLTASDAAEYDFFGFSVDIFFGRVIVGATGNDDGGTSSGSAYIFERSFGGVDFWGQRKKLTASDAAAFDYFGHSVSLDYEWAVVGAYGNDDSGYNTGSAYLFYNRQGGMNNWGQYAKITSSDAAGGDRFGIAVHNSDGFIFVGADNDDDTANGGGAVYVFEQGDAGLPAPESVTPSSGMASSQTFNAVYSDSQGADDLRYCYFKIADSAGAMADCVYLRYRRATNKLDLRNDLGTAWKGGYVLGTSNILQNANVSIDISTAKSNKAGNLLTLKLPLTFKRAFIGTHNIYMQALDMGYGDSGKTQMGTFTVNVAPENMNITPYTGSGGSQVFIGNYRDENGSGDLRYLYLKIADNASSQSSCAYFRYSPASGEIHLRSDSGGTWLGGYTIGSSNILENSQVRVDVSAVALSSYAYRLELSIPMEFKSGMVGSKNTYMNAIDLCYDNSGWQQMGEFICSENNFAPTNHSLSPTSGAGGWKTFEAVYRDINGSNDISYSYFKVADSAGATANCVYIRFRNITRRLDLRTNGGGGWIAGGDIGAAAILQNNQVRINMANVKASNIGDNLTVRLPLVFKSVFNGTHNLYMYCYDSAGNSSGWTNMGSFNVTATAPPAGETRVMSLSRELKRGERLYFNDYLSGANEAVWFVNDERLRGNDPSYRFNRNGIFRIGLSARNTEDQLLVGGDEIFVGEKIVRAGDLTSWNGEAVPIRAKGKEAIGILLTEGVVEDDLIVRLNTIFTPGMRVIFDNKNARNYSFIEMREGATPEEWLWVIGRSRNGEEQIVASTAAEPSDSSRMLALRLSPKAGNAGIYLDRKRLFAEVESKYGGGDILLLHQRFPADFDICVSRNAR